MDVGTIPIKSLKSTTYYDESILYKPMNTKNKIRTEKKCNLIMIHIYEYVSSKKLTHFHLDVCISAQDTVELCTLPTILYITFNINGTVEKRLHKRTFDGDGRTREIFYNDITIMMIKKKTKIILEQ